MLQKNAVPLSLAAVESGTPYHTMRAAVIRGAVEGERDEHGHWYVAVEEIKRLRAERAKSPGGKTQ